MNTDGNYKSLTRRYRRRAKPLIDENTIGVCPILGSTFNGEYEDVKGACVWSIDPCPLTFFLFIDRGLNGGAQIIHKTQSPTAIHDMLVELNAKTGWDVPIHVDAVRSVGMLALDGNPCMG